RTALGGTAPSRVIIDTSAFVGSTVGPSGTGDVGSAVSHITALMTDGARADPNDRRSNPEYYDSPDSAAGQLFAQALGIPGAAVVLGGVFWRPIARMGEQMLVDSDNVVAEMMARQVALAKGVEASFAGGAQATAAVLAEIGVPTPPGLGLVDGSGLSYDNQV